MAKVLKMPIQEKAASGQLRVAAYCRVSTGSEEQAGSLEQQIAAYQRMINENPGWRNVGVFAETVSGLNARERSEFQKLFRKCRQKRVDLILVKSISRFGRNSFEAIRALRDLNGLGVDVYFEIEKLHLQGAKLQLLIDIYCAFAQWESEAKSRSIKWGVRQGFETGSSGYAGFACYGYRCSGKGKLEIYEPEAEIVRTIFEMRASGSSLGRISDWLYENSISSPTGKERWSRETLNKLLHNEKYTGDVLLQKTFAKDLFSGKQVKNNGKIERFLIQNHHPGIVSREVFGEAQSSGRCQTNFP